jgi:hypothetical protein
MAIFYSRSRPAAWVWARHEVSIEIQHVGSTIMPQTREKTRMIHARVDPRLKTSAERVFSKIGISTT